MASSISQPLVLRQYVDQQAFPMLIALLLNPFQFENSEVAKTEKRDVEVRFLIGSHQPLHVPGFVTLLSHYTQPFLSVVVSTWIIDYKRC